MVSFYPASTLLPSFYPFPRKSDEMMMYIMSWWYDVYHVMTIMLTFSQVDVFMLKYDTEMMTYCNFMII